MVILAIQMTNSEDSPEMGSGRPCDVIEAVGLVFLRGGGYRASTPVACLRFNHVVFHLND